MNILNNKNKRTSIFKALALCLFAAVSFTFVRSHSSLSSVALL